MVPIPLQSERIAHSQGWKPALLHAAPISLFILGAFTYWFAVADRYAVFLYGHLGATAFDKVTTGRYWMSGLVVSGAVLILYSATNWLMGRIADQRQWNYRPPAWWSVWGLCVVPLIIGIPAITMNFNQPTLPASNAIACVVATTAGLAFALVPGAWAAQRPTDLVWLAFDGMGLMPSLLLLRAIELPGRGLISVTVAYVAALGGTLAGVAWLGLFSGLRVWRRKAFPEASHLLAAGICLSYLLMPLVHHLLSTPPGYRYITTSSNFFAFDPGIQLLVFLVAVALSNGVTQLRGKAFANYLSHNPAQKSGGYSV